MSWICFTGIDNDAMQLQGRATSRCHLGLAGWRAHHLNVMWLWIYHVSTSGLYWTEWHMWPQSHAGSYPKQDHFSLASPCVPLNKISETGVFWFFSRKKTCISTLVCQLNRGVICPLGYFSVQLFFVCIEVVSSSTVLPSVLKIIDKMQNLMALLGSHKSNVGPNQGQN